MNDLEILHDAWPTPDPPSDATRAHARADLLARAIADRPTHAARAEARAALATRAVADRQRPTDAVDGGRRTAPIADRGRRAATSADRGRRAATSADRGRRAATSGDRGGRRAAAGDRGGRPAAAGDRGGRPAAAGDRGRRSAARAAGVSRSRVRRRPAGAVVVALVAAAAVIVLANLGSTGPDGQLRPVVPGLPSVPVAAAEVLERAAVAAEERPFTAPRDDQWIYMEERVTSSDGGEPVIRRTWRRADGRGFAFVDRGRLRVEIMRKRIPRERRVPGVLDGYRQLAALPTDPDALLRWGYDLAEDVTGAGLTEDGDVYAIFRGTLGDNVLPPELEAALFRAMKRIPGVTVRTVEIFGRRAISLGLTEDWLRQELLLDPRTYAMRGQRSTVARDAVIHPFKAGNATGEVRKGDVVVSERLVTAIVDEPGDRR